VLFFLHFFISFFSCNGVLLAIHFLSSLATSVCFYPSLQESTKGYLNWQQSLKHTRTCRWTKSTHNTSELCNTHVWSPKRPQHWPNNHNTTKKTKFLNKLRISPTTNTTAEEQSAFALDIPTCGPNQTTQSLKLSLKIQPPMVESVHVSPQFHKP